MSDLISRQAAIDALADYIHNVDKAYSTGKLSAYDCKDAAWSVLGDLPSVPPTIMRSIGELVGYTGEPCPNCGRFRVERYESGLEICEKCKWCEQTKSYWLDGV